MIISKKDKEFFKNARNMHKSLVDTLIKEMSITNTIIKKLKGDII